MSTLTLKNESLIRNDCIYVFTDLCCAIRSIESAASIIVYKLSREQEKMTKLWKPPKKELKLIYKILGV